ncbi:MAG TPA: hypothetical protein VFX86_01020 [Candidatus Saccharimonadales bacterium]|nr:hypothetical protein [Candidatus Saccharimonadales bacterium]
MPGENWNPYAENDDDEEARRAEEARKQAEEEARRAEELSRILGGGEEKGLFGFAPETDNEGDAEEEKREDEVFGFPEAEPETDESESPDQETTPPTSQETGTSDDEGQADEAEGALDIDHSSGGAEENDQPGESEEIPADETEEGETPDSITDASAETEPAESEHIAPDEAEPSASDTDAPEKAAGEHGELAEDEHVEIPRDAPAEPVQTEGEPPLEPADTEEPEPEEPAEADAPTVETDVTDKEEQQAALDNEDTREGLMPADEGSAAAETAQEAEGETAEPEPIPEHSEPDPNGSLDADKTKIPHHTPEKTEIALDDTESGLPPDQKPKEPSELEAEVPEAESPEDEEIQVPAHEQEADDEGISEGEANEMLREQKNARRKVLEEFRRQQEAQIDKDAEAGKPAQPNKGIKEYMDEMAPAILVGSFIDDSSKRRDRKLGRRIDEANQDLEKLKVDTQDSIEARARRAETRQEASIETELADAQQAEESSEAQAGRNDITGESMPDTVYMAPEAGEHPEQKTLAHNESQDGDNILAETIPDEQVARANQELSTSGEMDRTSGEETYIETLATQNEMHQNRPEELGFDERQERAASQPPPDDSVIPSESQRSTRSGATPLSDILTDRSAQLDGSVDMQSINDQNPPQISEQDNTEHYKPAIKAGFITGVIVISLVAIYLIFR